MKDAEGTILYVGKAISLYNRVRSYFQEATDLSPKNRSMVAKIDDIEFLVVQNEVEALVLESNYIKQYRPKYNVLLRDDKNYPYIKVALSEDFPRVYRVRSFKRDGNRYFGPYTNSGAVDATLDLLNKLFAFRTCRYDASVWAEPRDGETPAGWKQKLLPRPCTQYYIHRCIAPCVAYTSREEYDAVIQQVILFLEGKHDEVLKDLEVQMERAAENLNFEDAARIRDRIKAVERILEKQRIINTEGQDDQDVVALASGDDETCAQVFFFRNGKLVGREYFILQGTRESTPGEVMTSFLQQFYETATHIPAEIIVEVEPDDRTVLQAWLKERRKNATITGGSQAAVTISAPKRGDKVRLVEMVKQNAREVLEQQRIKWLTDSQKTQLALEELQEALNLAVPPQRIECYDISNTQGTNSVGAMVVFEGGRPKNSEYRRFKIKTVEGSNDFASHQEVLRRRFRKAAQTAAREGSVEEETAVALDEALTGGNGEVDENDGKAQLHHEWALPNLVIIDGGKGQLSAAMEVMQELHLDIPTIGVAKENHTQTSSLEEIYTPGASEPIILPRSSQGLYLVQRIRDEAHRFSITYHRKLRSERTFKSVLDEIPGIGPKRKQALMKHFGSVRAISSASIDELAALDGMTRDAAEKVKEYIGRLE